jgi:hypothetical protein
MQNDGLRQAIGGTRSRQRSLRGERGRCAALHRDTEQLSLRCQLSSRLSFLSPRFKVSYHFIFVSLLSSISHSLHLFITFLPRITMHRCTNYNNHLSKKGSLRLFQLLLPFVGSTVLPPSVAGSEDLGRSASPFEQSQLPSDSSAVHEDTQPPSTLVVEEMGSLPSSPSFSSPNPRTDSHVAPLPLMTSPKKRRNEVERINEGTPRKSSRNKSLRDARLRNSGIDHSHPLLAVLYHTSLPL